MAELLLELLSEEIPARMQARAAEDLKRLVVDALKIMGLNFSEARTFATPRRLGLVIDGLPLVRADVREEKRGPRVGAPDQAINGFLNNAGLASLDQAEKRDTGKGEFWFVVIEKKGGPTAEALPGAIDMALKLMPWPKSMKWGSGTMVWVRPLQSVIALFDGKVLEGEVVPGGSMAPIPFGDTTRGHRFLSKGEIKVTGFADYVEKLRAGYVLVDPLERETIIQDESMRLCIAANVGLVHDMGLRTEVAGLVEWPVPLIGTIDPDFMQLPPEVLIVSMRMHQRYFATHSEKDGNLTNRFVVVANNVARDGGETIIAGNERVLRARLSDAKFFWDQDRKVRLEDRLPTLNDVVFHAKLGTQASRVSLLVSVAREIAGFLPGASIPSVVQAARLSKADLTSGMVGEFPELQGVMGRYYALSEKLSLDVADAIRDHYLPQGPKDHCPQHLTSIAVALADKALLLGQFWAIGEKPSGSRDPFALRRAALGVVRIIVEHNLRIPLRNVFCRVVDRVLTETYYAGKLSALDAIDELKNKGIPDDQVEALASRFSGGVKALGGESDSDDYEYPGITQFPGYKERGDELTESLLTFLLERLKVQTRDQGTRHDVVDAVFALGGEDDLVRLLVRVAALQAFLGSEAGKNLLTGYGRAANIVRAEEKKDKTLAARIASAPEPQLLEQAEESAVASALAAVQSNIQAALAREDFAGAMTFFADLRAPIDAFFDKVTVNVTDRPELRLNRLKLLNQIRATMDSVADFSKIEG